METETLLKQTPLAGAHRKHKAVFLKKDGWEIAGDYGDPVGEAAQLKTGSLLIDWSHVGKILIRGGPGSS